MSDKNTASYNRKSRHHVLVSHVTSHPKLKGDIVMNVKKGTTGTRCNWVFDFHKVTIEEILIAAVKHLVIAYRKNWQGLGANEARDNIEQTISVREMLDAGRKPKQPKDRVSTALDAIKGMTPEEFEKIQKMFQTKIAV